LLIDSTHPDWAASGLQIASVANCSNLFTVKNHHVLRTIGKLSAVTMQDIDKCLKAALGIP
jgi:hypothetical protein